MLYLTSAAEQKRRAIAGSYAPTIKSLYEDADVLAANPFFADLVVRRSRFVPSLSPYGLAEPFGRSVP